MEREYDGAKLDEFGMELVVEIVYGKILGLNKFAKHVPQCFWSILLTF